MTENIIPHEESSISSIITPEKIKMKTNNVCQVNWNQSNAIEALDILMNLYHIGSPTFLIKEEKEGSMGLAIWLDPCLNMIPHQEFKLFNRIEIRSQQNPSFDSPNYCVYFSLRYCQLFPQQRIDFAKLEALQKEGFMNIVMNFINQEVTLLGSTLSETFCFCALLQDYLQDKIPLNQFSSIWENMIDDLEAENQNMISLSNKNSQKYIKNETLLKFLPLTYHFIQRLVKD